MPILARFTNFENFMIFKKVVATALLGISKISTINFENHSLSCYLFEKFLFSGDTNLCDGKLNSG